MRLSILLFPLLVWGQFFMPRWREEDQFDPNHCHYRRFTSQYRGKSRLVKSLWIVNGLIMLSMASPAFMVSFGLFMTFVSLMICDETD
ncbi:wax ester/triacylglycerol synthase family O-acyltransferase [Marinibactrum halimedae]|uniref:Uncharacterized protein n=1 Tax=Marinibactrum halimedae TaxID=1444977 RepID=A0AA37T6V3_9GAMM|nr:wax ester/triacylglycerol synthase family O-acyltransferase [Marinibactrum halimedae]MCD9460962.1 wax ester/triacylglycerol synthase family O-acyltransferase [Marinibactrum halimedae]GLS28095.1 hypothetical protein GCM10007877_38140 [Marinibactrum halimedae]